LAAYSIDSSARDKTKKEVLAQRRKDAKVSKDSVSAYSSLRLCAFARELP